MHTFNNFFRHNIRYLPGVWFLCAVASIHETVRKYSTKHEKDESKCHAETNDHSSVWEKMHGYTVSMFSSFYSKYHVCVSLFYYFCFANNKACYLKEHFNITFIR